MDLEKLALKQEIAGMAKRSFDTIRPDDKEICSERELVIAGVAGILEAREDMQKGSTKKYDFLTVIDTIDEFLVEVHGG